jgi:methyl-accepting chemotaxis protein
VASNIAHASDGVRDANARVAQTADAALGIAREIATTNQVASQSQRDSTVVKEGAKQLAELAASLKGRVSQFKV